MKNYSSEVIIFAFKELDFIDSKYIIVTKIIIVKNLKNSDKNFMNFFKEYMIIKNYYYY